MRPPARLASLNPGGPRSIPSVAIRTGFVLTRSVADFSMRKPTEGGTVAGAVLAGLALSETFFHSRDSSTHPYVSHAKFRV